MSEISYRIAQNDDVESVYNFEMNRLFADKKDDFEVQIQTWTSSYRKESLEHYFKLGWSFVAEDKSNTICGFFLAQPFLFVDAQTQSLWVEYISASAPQVHWGLCDLAYRLSREKHFQKVYLPSEVAKLYKEQWPMQQNWIRETVFLKTTKSM